jgi:hypothetical protein
VVIRDRDFKRAAVALRPHLGGLVLLVSIVVSSCAWLGVEAAAVGEPFRDRAHYAQAIAATGAIATFILLALCAGPFAGYVKSQRAWLPRRDRTLRLAWGAPLGMVFVIAWCVPYAIVCASHVSFGFTMGARPDLSSSWGQLVRIVGQPWIAPIAWLLGAWLMGAMVDPGTIRRWLGFVTPGRCARCGYPVKENERCSECGEVHTIDHPEERRPW